MKRFVIAVLILFCFNLSQAQENDHKRFGTGDMFASGLIGYHSVSNPDHSKEKKFEFVPRFGYFINDFFAVGGRLGYTYNVVKTSDNTKIAENSTFTIGVFGRYYLLPGSKFAPFAELGVGFGSTQNIDHKHTNGVNAALAPGISYFLNQHFALEATFGVLSYNTVKPDGDNGSTDSFDVGLDLEHINFGIIYKF